MKKNTCIAFSPQNNITFGFNTRGQPNMKNIQTVNPNDYFFIQKFSYLIKEKAIEIVEMQSKEK